MDLFNKSQIVGVVLFFAGSGILTFCNRYERKVDEKLKDPKIRWAVLDGNKNTLIKEKSVRGTVMTLMGVGMALYGIVLFLKNIE